MVAGSSLAVHPAAGLLTTTRATNEILINDQPTPYDGRANLVIRIE